MTDTYEAALQRFAAKALAIKKGLPVPERRKLRVPTTKDLPLTEWITALQLSLMTGIPRRSIHNRMWRNPDVERRKVRRQVEWRWKRKQVN